MRDSQRQRVYDAERSIQAFDRTEDRIGDIKYVERWVKKVTSSKWFVKHYGVRHIHVGDGRRRRSANAYRTVLGSRVSFPRWARFKLAILHEIAHCASPRDSKHNWVFSFHYLSLVKHFMGKEDHLELKKAFKTFRVRFRKPRKGRPGGNPNGIAALLRWRKDQTDKITNKPA